MKFAKLNLFTLAFLSAFGLVSMASGQTSPPAGAADRLKGAGRGKPSGQAGIPSAQVPPHLGSKVPVMGGSDGPTPTVSTKVDASFVFNIGDCVSGERKMIYSKDGKTLLGSKGQNYICEIKFSCKSKKDQAGQGDKSGSSNSLSAKLTATCWPKPLDVAGGSKSQFSCEMTWEECTGKYALNEVGHEEREGRPGTSDFPRDATPAAGSP